MKIAKIYLDEVAKTGVDNVREEWYNGRGLFKFCTKDGRARDGSGCLTMVHYSGRYPDVVDGEGNVRLDLMERIIADNRFHIGLDGMVEAMRRDGNKVLLPFAEWQTILDGEIRGIVYSEEELVEIP